MTNPTTTPKIIAFTLLAGLLAGCQTSQNTSTSTSASSEPAKKPASLCEKYKNAGDYNTPQGRAMAKAICTGNIDDSNYVYRELARQNTCKTETGRLCDD
ncbi:hypothetical protein [Roseibium sp. RKSG952]|uniref:hypothetical protein n=1 Tax=Roseibium sp. RKSG952 TaxID=2529384 RepID=UPI0012BCBA0D|nr:hypothetical protein [Roseibium sp. RKSG952]MTH97989.1 hypothetical protein [Roseibium sp. RKSG952]